MCQARGMIATLAIVKRPVVDSALHTPTINTQQSGMAHTQLWVKIVRPSILRNAPTILEKATEIPDYGQNSINEALTDNINFHQWKSQLSLS